MTKVTLLQEFVKVEWNWDDGHPIENKETITRFEVISETLERALLILNDAQYSKNSKDGVLKAIEMKEGGDRWCWQEVHTSVLSINDKKPNKNTVYAFFNKANL